MDGFAFKHGGSELRSSSPVTLTSKIGTYCNDRRPTNGDEARKRQRNHARQKRLEKLQRRIMMEYQTERFPFIVKELIEDFVARMNLSKRVCMYANALVSKYMARKDQPVRKTKILAAVFTFMACRRVGCDRSFQDFVDTGLVRKRELGLHYKRLSKLMKIKTAGANPCQLMKHYYHRFQMTTKERIKAERALKDILQSNVLGGRSPKSLMSVALYRVLKTRPMSIQEISRRLGLASNTSNHCLNILYKKE